MALQPTSSEARYTTSSIDAVYLKTSLGTMHFHIVNVNTPFLLCLKNMNRLKAVFDNIVNQIVQSNAKHSIIRRYDHAFLLWHTSVYCIVKKSLNINFCFLTEVELRRFHRRFEHSSVRRLHQMLKRSDHNVKMKALRHLTKYCEHCQKHDKSSNKFSFTIKNDIDFNYNIIVDIFCIQNKPMLHIVDEATRFQAERWLKNISTKTI